jgi:uncharacterized protein
MAANYRPVTKKERIVVLDVLRGFALMGILFANILSWSGIKFLPIEEIKALGDFSSDVFLYKLLKYFVDTKFYTIFSILFGIGFSLQISKYKDTPGFIPLYRRRLALLFVIGMLHALIWSGDILTLYALIGFLFILFRNMETEKLFKIALVLLVMPVLLDIIYMFTFADSIKVLPKIALKVYPDLPPLDIVRGFQSGDLITTFKTNFHNLLWRWFDFIPTGRPFKVLALFILGFYLYKVNFFHNFATKWKNFTILFLIGILFTTGSIQYGGSIAIFSKTWGNILYKVLHEIGQFTLAISYMVLLNLLVLKFPKFFIWNLLKNYGRMSLTSYIGQTTIGIVIFYPIVAFGYFGKLSLTDVYLLAIFILLFQIGFSVLWFKFFAFGPIEYLWRCAIYKKWFPFLIKENK